MKKIILLLGVFIFLGGACWPLYAQAKTDVYIGITSTGSNKLPAIGLPPFKFADEQSRDAAVSVRDVMRSDLLFARYFDINEEGPAFDTAKLSETLTQWGKLRASYLLVGDISYAAPYYTIKIYVYDIATRSAVFA